MYGIIDVGSNTIRLVVYTYQDNQLTTVLNTAEMACLAGYVEQGCLTAAGIEKACNSIQKLYDIAKKFPLEGFYAFATASLRNIQNTEEAVKKIQTETGISVEVISGEQEAIYDFNGVKQDERLTSGVVVDIGGGSTELVLYQKREMVSAQSLPFGSLSLSKRFVADIYPTKEERLLMKDFVTKQLSSIEKTPCNQVCGIGGSILSLESLFEGPLDIQKILQVADVLPEFLQKTIQEKAPERRHTILTGAVILDAVMDYFDVRELFTNTNGVKEGYLLQKIQ